MTGILMLATLQFSMVLQVASTSGQQMLGSNLLLTLFAITVSSKRLPETIAHVRITHQSWQQGEIAGEVIASSYVWQFQWCFRRGELFVSPSLGRSLIKEPLGRFLERQDYQLEPGGDYFFKIRSQF